MRKNFAREKRLFKHNVGSTETTMTSIRQYLRFAKVHSISFGTLFWETCNFNTERRVLQISFYLGSKDELQSLPTQFILFQYLVAMLQMFIIDRKSPNHVVSRAKNLMFVADLVRGTTTLSVFKHYFELAIRGFPVFHFIAAFDSFGV